MEKTQFYPIRFRNSRPYSRDLLTLLQQIYKTGRANPTIAFDTASKLLFQQLKKEKIPIPTHDVGSDFSRKFAMQNMAALAWAQWSLSESQLYCFDDALIEAFKNSSSLDLSVNNLHFPFSHFYFYFGVQNNMPLEGGKLFVDGAYVFYNNISLRIILTGIWQLELVNEEPPHWFSREAECYDLRIPAQFFDQKLNLAIEKSLEMDIVDLELTYSKVSNSVREQLNNGAIQGYINSHQANHDSYMKACSLIANGLCYLTAYPEDQETVWQKNTPSRLLNMTNSSKIKEKNRAVSKLNSMGFSIIHQVGTEFGDSLRAGPKESDVLHGGVRTHWRRGHWRMQVHGERNTLKKIIWIKPVRVGIPSDEDMSRIRKID